MIIRLAMIAGAAFAASGCAMLHTDARVYERSGLYVWASDYSAGIGTQHGVCVQSATTMTAANLEANIEASNELMKLANPAMTDTNEGALINLGVQQTETVAQTNTSTAQTAYANIAYFYLCQITLNRQQMTDQQIVTMWEASTNAIAAIGQTSGAVNQLKPDEIEARERNARTGNAGTGSTATDNTGTSSTGTGNTGTEND